MTLTLVAVSLNDQPLSQPITAGFDTRGGTIGRADHNTMALPDPQRHVSRLQAEVVAQGASYLIRNVGAANPITVGTRALGRGETQVLSDRDQIRIGGYLLKVQFDAGEQTAPHPASRAMSSGPHTRPGALRTSAPPPAMSASNPFADLMGGSEPQGGTDPFAGLMPAPAGIDPRSAGLSPVHSKPASASQRLPDDFDPFAAAPTANPAPSTLASDPFADLLPGGAAPSIDQAFNLGASGDDPLAQFIAPAPPDDRRHSAPAGGGVPIDPMALFAGAPTAAPSTGTPQPDNLPARHAAYQPPPLRTEAARPAAAPAPAVQASPAPAARPATAPAAASMTTDASAMWSAFCEGAGVDLPQPPGPPIDCMRNMGRILRSAIEGTLQLMAVRATTKHELHAAVTMIRHSDNNPLKFSPDGKAGLEQLLRPALRGFLDGPTAMDDAMSDLVGHAIGTVAGMRAAIDGMLGRFAPQALESKLTGDSMLDALLPMNRRARLWDLYLQHHRAIRDEAQEDFHALFGKAFVAAYEQQIERIRRNA